MKGSKYARTLAKIQVRGKISYTRYSKKCLTQIYRDLYGVAMATETSVTEFCYKSVNLFFEELINIKVILFLIHKLFR